MLSVDLAAELPFLQAQAESMMVTPCVIRRGGTVTADPATGADVLVGGVSVYEGGCKVQSREGEVASAEVADSTVASVRWEIHVPASSGPFQQGDVVEALGRQFRVEAPHVKSWQSAQRLPVSEVLL
jgi:hypothetical protein